MKLAVKPGSGGRLIALVLLGFLCLSGVEAEPTGGVVGFLRQLESRVEKKTFWFYRFFGMKQEEKKVNMAQDCDYDDPNKIQFCSPVNVNPRLAVNHNPNLPYTGPKRGPKAALPSKCLEDPDDPDCRKLTGASSNSMSGSGSRPGAQAATVASSSSSQVSLCSQEGEVKLISEDSTVGLPAGAVEVVGSQGSSVTFKITQLWKSTSVGWVQPAYKKGGRTCDLADRTSSVDGGFALQFTAECIGGKASLDLYVQDSTFVGASASDFHDCSDWNTDVALYSLELACDGSNLCDVGAEQGGGSADSVVVTQNDDDVPLPEGTVAVTGYGGNSVTFTITQKWKTTDSIDECKRTTMSNYTRNNSTCVAIHTKM